MEDRTKIITNSIIVFSMTIWGYFQTTPDTRNFGASFIAAVIVWLLVKLLWYFFSEIIDITFRS